jgi:hypothetical protein
MFFFPTRVHFVYVTLTKHSVPDGPVQNFEFERVNDSTQDQRPKLQLSKTSICELVQQISSTRMTMYNVVVTLQCCGRGR